MVLEDEERQCGVCINNRALGCEEQRKAQEKVELPKDATGQRKAKSEAVKSITRRHRKEVCRKVTYGIHKPHFQLGSQSSIV